MTFAEAIAQMENTPSGLNNPCALTAAPSSYCQTGKQGILVQFCSVQDGWDACNNQISLNANRGLNVNTFFGGQPGVYAGYAPASAGNDPTNYANTVAGWLGIDPSTTLADLPGSQLYYTGGGSGGSNPVQVASAVSADTGNGTGVTFDLSTLGIDPMSLGLGLLGLLGLVLISKVLG